MALTLLIPLGALLGWLYERWADKHSNPAFAKRMGVLAATGLIVGESLLGVAFAGVVAATGKDAPLAVVGPDFEHTARWIGVALFAGGIAMLYRSARRTCQAG